jgi:hypothetical protein
MVFKRSSRIRRTAFHPAYACSSALPVETAEERLESVLVLAAALSPEVVAKAAVLVVGTRRMLRDFARLVRVGVLGREPPLDAADRLSHDEAAPLVGIDPGEPVNDNGGERRPRAGPQRARRGGRARRAV